MALPWLTPPPTRRTVTVGDATTGTLQLEVHGNLLWGETVAIADLMEQEDNTTTAAAQVAETIAAAEGVSLLEAYDLVQGAVMGSLSDADRGRMLRWQADVDRLRAMFTRIGQTRMAATVTAIVQHRLDPGWTMEQTRTLDAALFEALWQFAESERQRTTPTPPTEDELKKRPPGRQKRRTGKESAGPSSPSTPDSSPSSDSPEPERTPF